MAQENQQQQEKEPSANRLRQLRSELSPSLEDGSRVTTEQVTDTENAGRSYPIHQPLPLGSSYLANAPDVPPDVEMESYPKDLNADPAAEQKRYQVASAAAKAKGRITLLGLDQIQTINETKGFWAFVEHQMRRMFNPEYVDKSKDWYERNRDSFSIWLSTLKAIEGKFGSAVMVTFAFLRSIFLLNVTLSILWAFLIIFPFFTHPPRSYSWSLLEASQSKKDHYLDSTWVFYGGYNYTSGEQKGWYRTDYMYTLVVGAMLLLTLATVLGRFLDIDEGGNKKNLACRMASRIMGAGDVTNAYKSAVYPFSTVIFASWDFHLSSEESSSNLRRGIRMRLREMLADCAETQQEIATTDRRKIYKRNVALFVLFPTLMSSTVTAVIFLVSKQAAIDASLRFMKGFAQPLLLAAVNISSPRLIRMLVDMEDWKPSTADQVLLVKLYFIRMLNVGTLFYRLYAVLEEARIAKEGTSMKACHGGKCTEGLLCCMEKEAYENVWPTCRPSKVGYCVADCADNAVAKLLLQLMISSTLVDNIAEAAKGYFMVYYYKCRMQMSIEDMPVRVVYIQAVVWVASMFSPVASALGATCNCISFLCMKEVLMRTCKPMEKAYSASSTSNITYGLLLITLILSSIPIVFRLTSPSSGICGPVKEGLSGYKVITNYIEKAPTAIWVTYEWLTNPMIMGGVILLLSFVAVLLRARIAQIHKSVELTARELGMQQNEAREKIALMRSQHQAPKSAARVQHT